MVARLNQEEKSLFFSKELVSDHSALLNLGFPIMRSWVQFLPVTWLLQCPLLLSRVAGIVINTLALFEEAKNVDGDGCSLSVW